MNIFIKFNEKRISITIKNNNISIFELIKQIKNEITTKDEIKIEIKNFNLKLFYNKIELLNEKKLNEYNIKNNDEIIAKIIIYSNSLVEEKQFLFKNEKNKIDIIVIEKKKLNLFLIDLKIIFENNEFYEIENDFNKNLILKLKNRFFEKNNLFKQEFISCGAFHSMIYNNSFYFFYFNFNF
jgi:hypothetical protein